MPVIVADKKGRSDGSALDMLQMVDSPLPIVLITWVDGYEFNDELLKLEKWKFIIADFIEMGWEYDWENGHTLENYWGKLCGSEWQKFRDFAQNTRLCLKRELRRKDMVGGYVPIEYPCRNEISPIVSEEEFNSRPFEVFFNWGLSNQMRPKLHGNIFYESENFGYRVCDNFYNLQAFIDNEKEHRKWVTINTPHYARFKIEQVLHVNGLSKLSVCLWGSGRKCFRTTGESPLNSVMILPEDNFTYQFEWEDGFNCIKIKNVNNPFPEIEAATHRKDLYEIYKNGVATCEKYYLPNYIAHLEKIIKENT